MKSVEDALTENAFWAAYVQKSAAETAYADLFDAAFDEHTAKLAALDPSYAEMLQVEQQKIAFDEAYRATLAQYGIA
jgi:hypothetical protein